MSRARESSVKVAVAVVIAVVVVAATVAAVLGAAEWTAGELSRVYAGAVAALLLLAEVKLPGGTDRGGSVGLAVIKAASVLGAAEFTSAFIGG